MGEICTDVLLIVEREREGGRERGRGGRERGRYALMLLC